MPNLFQIPFGENHLEGKTLHYQKNRIVERVGAKHLLCK
jgi:hypothetical protein